MVTATRLRAEEAEDFEAAAQAVNGAGSAGEVFGSTADMDAARRRYRRLVQHLHPDRVAPAQREAAQGATARLTVLWDQFRTGAAGRVTVTSKRFTYAIEALLGTDGMTNLYPCSWERDGSTRYGEMRLPLDVRDNDLVNAEAKALRRLNDADEKFRDYAPKLVEAFRYRDAKTGATRQAVVTERIDGLFSLAEVERAYPSGIGGRDGAWMWRRMLAGAGWAHRAGVVHGAILPEQVLIHPAEHGVVLANWCYSAIDGAAVPAMVARYADWYPTSVVAKEPAGPRTDIHLIARTMLGLLGPSAPAPFRAFARGCMLASTPADAWEVQHDFDELLERLYGRRRFQPFHMPA